MPSERLQSPAASSRRFMSAFTLMELMVSISILVLIILGVGLTFQGASKSVSVSQATMEMLANVRAVQSHVDKLVSSVDKNSFLVIRGRRFANNANSFRFDQVGFVAYGAFANRTGSNNTATPFQESTVANAAHVWIGQLVMEKNVQTAGTYNVGGALAPNQQAMVPINQLPTGGDLVNENQCVLGIHQTLMVPGPRNGSLASPGGVAVPAYTSILYNSGNISGAEVNTAVPITTARFSVAAMTPGDLQQVLREFGVSQINPPSAEWARLCYRFKALASPYDTDETNQPFVNGYFRMHPIALQGVSSLRIDWTDNSVDANKQVRWFGAGEAAQTYTQVNAAIGGLIETPYNASGDATTGDNYMAVWGTHNRSYWPKALRFSYHIVDPNNRLVGGRDFVQVVKLPD